MPLPSTQQLEAVPEAEPGGGGGESTENARSASDDFQEGPGLFDIIKTVHRFLHEWSLRPWSLWKEHLVSEAWSPWKAAILVRLATVLWLLGSQLILAAVVVGVLSLLPILFGQ